MARVVAVCNQKGGVAKTTTCISLGAALTELGQRVLLVDGDPQGNLALSLGLAEGSAAEGKLGAAGEGAWKERLLHPEAMPALAVLAGGPRLALQGNDGRGNAWPAATVRALRADFDWVLIDCPPSLGRLTLGPLEVADEVLVPVQCEFLAAQGLLQMMTIVEALQKRRKDPLVVRVLAVMFDRRKNLSRQVLERYRAAFPEILCETVIGVDARLSECPILGEPVTVYAPRSRGSQQYRALAQEMLGLLQKGESPT